MYLNFQALILLMQILFFMLIFSYLFTDHTAR